MASLTMMWTQNDGNEAKAFRRLEKSMLSLLLICKPDGLRTFTYAYTSFIAIFKSSITNIWCSWRLRTCVLDQILGSNGYLPLKQKQLESLHLITDGNCSRHDLALKEFKRLKALSWIGLRSDVDLLALHHCFKEVSHQLIYLTLDFLRWDLVPGFLYRHPNFITWSIVMCARNNTTYSFPALKHLSLSAFSFEPISTTLASSFDWNSLQSLRLRFCLGWENF